MEKKHCFLERNTTKRSQMPPAVVEVKAVFLNPNTRQLTYNNIKQWATTPPPEHEHNIWAGVEEYLGFKCTWCHPEMFDVIFATPSSLFLIQTGFFNSDVADLIRSYFTTTPEPMGANAVLCLVNGEHIAKISLAQHLAILKSDDQHRQQHENFTSLLSSMQKQF